MEHAVYMHKVQLRSHDAETHANPEINKIGHKVLNCELITYRHESWIQLFKRFSLMKENKLLIRIKNAA